MKSIYRRTALVAAGTVAVGTVATVALWRKPAPPIHVIAAEGGGHVALQPFSSLQKTDPPAAPAAASLLDAEGKSHAVTEFAGKILVVNMWATWCVPCVAEMPALQALAAKAATAGILVLPLSSDRGGREVVEKFYANHGLTGLPIWLDPKGEVGRAWGARGLPTTYIIDRKGMLRGKLEGAVDWGSDETIKAITALAG